MCKRDSHFFYNSMSEYLVPIGDGSSSAGEDTYNLN